MQKVYFTKAALGRGLLFVSVFSLVGCLGGGESEEGAPQIDIPGLTNGGSIATPTPAPTPNLSSAPVIQNAPVEGEALGWQSGSLPLKFTFSPNTGTNYLCRAGKASEINTKSFQNCDGTSGTNPEFSTATLASGGDGSYQLDVKMTYGSAESPVATAKWYAHSSLNNVTKCSQAHTDDQYFAKAAEFLPPSAAFAGTVNVKSPEVSLPFASSTATLLSLRRKFSVSSDSKMVLMKRVYQSTHNSDCQNRVSTGFTNSSPGPRPAKEVLDCHALVMNRDGVAVCLRSNGGTVEYVRSIRNAAVKLASTSSKMFSDKSRDPSSAGDPEVLFLPE